MKKKQSSFQKVSRLLNTSSETCMLIALIALFALPFVIASNLEPMVKDAEKSASAPFPTVQNSTAAQTTIQKQLPLAQKDVSVTQLPTTVETETAVLGTSVNVNPFEITSDANNLKFFAKAEEVTTESSYALNLSTTKTFGKMSLFKVKNNSTEMRTYSFNVSNSGTNGAGKRSIFLKNIEYPINTIYVPKSFTLNSGEEAWVALTSQAAKPTNLKVSVDLVK